MTFQPKKPTKKKSRRTAHNEKIQLTGFMELYIQVIGNTKSLFCLLFNIYIYKKIIKCTLMNKRSFDY